MNNKISIVFLALFLILVVAACGTTPVPTTVPTVTAMPTATPVPTVPQPPSYCAMIMPEKVEWNDYTAAYTGTYEVYVGSIHGTGCSITTPMYTNPPENLLPMFNAGKVTCREYVFTCKAGTSAIVCSWEQRK